MKIKALKYLISNNKKLFSKIFLKKPFFYSLRYLQSALFSKRVIERSALLLGIKSISEFKSLVKDKENLLILGFSYCQKPISCPASRFSEHCLKKKCEKCPISSNFPNGKNIYSLCIPTIAFLGEKIFEMIEKKSFKNILFVITACDLSISMFKDIAMMLNLKGIALKLGGKTCKNFKTFLKAEEGKKKNQTVLSAEKWQLIAEILQLKKGPGTNI